MPVINTASKLYRGTSLVEKAYKGTNLVWTGTPPPPATPVAWPDSSNVGFLRAPGYPGSLTAGPGSFTANTTYSYMDFTEAGDVYVNVPNVTFYGCRFRQNWTDGWAVKTAHSSGTSTFKFCTFRPPPAITIPNAAWPSAGAGVDVDGTTSPGYVPYMIAYANSYQYGILQEDGALTVEDCDIWGFGNSIVLFGNDQKIIRRNWIHDAANEGLSSSNPYHHDGPGHLDGGGCSNVLIEDNVIASLGNTNAIAFQAASSGYQNIIVRRNFLSGFNYCVDMCHNASGNTGLVYEDNIHATDIAWALGPLYADFSTQFGLSANVWRRNKLRVLAGTTPRPSSVFAFTSADDGKYLLPTIAKSTTDWATGGAGGGGPGASPGPVYRSFSNTTYGSRSSTLVSKPIGTTADDILIATVYQLRVGAAPTVVTPPSGWTQFGTTITGTGPATEQTKFTAWWKRATASEPASYTWAQTETNTTQVVIQAWSGCLASGDPIDAVGQNTGLSTTASMSGVTTTTANTRLLWLGQTWDGAGTLTPPTGMTERYDHINYRSDEARATAGATGSRSQTQPSSGRWSVFLVALKPVGAAPVLTAPTFRSQSTVGYAMRNDTLVTKPAGTAENDILICGVLIVRGPAPTDPVTPSGWTQLGTYTSGLQAATTGKFGVFWKRAGASEPADYTWAQWESAQTEAIMLAYSGCPTSGSPIDAFTQNSAATGATATGTGLTTTQTNDVLFYLGHNWEGSGALTPPTGMTERFDSVAYAATETIAAAGTTGDRTQTLESSNPWAAFLVALKGI